ncbi:FecR family protein [Sphingobacterium sp. Ag1]|uniref:FecR family protein n=1 Tax=Sphingobacterium sp. Ag1 TaxID=1643451 RepID=UPI000A670613|nr:FecR family protein [Sphingobacterium sp. Ag1]
MENQRIFEEQFIIPLLTRYVRGEQLTPLELSTVKIWTNKNEYNKKVFQELLDNEQLAKNLVDFDSAQSTTEDRLKKLHAKLDRKKSVKKLRYWVSAAAVLLFLSIPLLMYKHKKDNTRENIITTSADIDPGKDQATLSLGDGSRIALECKTLTMDKDGQIYLDGRSISDSKMQYATLSTPRKGQYKTVLPDGTQVWLNAESTLKYPTRFTGNKREVELEGEGYFEVTHNAKKPFIVTSRGQRLKVLGTKFNINSYENETAISTTLVSGSVELTNSQNPTPVLLKPGQQGKLYSLSSICSVEDVDTEVYTAWTSNEFQFAATPLKEVLKQLERWYDIDVDYKKVPNIKVHATISREKKLSTVLYTLEQITDLNFKVTGRRIDIIDNK